MSLPPAQEEPLKNIELESTMFGINMALTPEEELEARQKFLDCLAVSKIVLPTVNPVETQPDGSIKPGADITFVVVETNDGSSGVPAFTTLGGLKSALPKANNGLFLNGAQAAAIISQSPHYLFVDGPDMHVQVEPAELSNMAQRMQQLMAAQQAEADRNEALEVALKDWLAEDSEATREVVVQAFLGGYCRIPVAGERDVDAKVVMIRSGPDENTAQQIPLLTIDGHLLCFTSEGAMNAWQQEPRNAVALPGAMIAELVAKTGVPAIAINADSTPSGVLHFDQNRLVVA